MKINKNLMSINHTAMKRTKNDIKYIFIHYVGALGDAKANTDYYKSTYVGASADFWVGFSGDIWQGNDYYNYYSWAVGGSGNGPYINKAFNSNSISIEMCVRKRSTKTMNATDKDWYFEDATVESAAELTASLMKELDIDIDHVIRHYDRTGKICPNPFVYNNGKVTWDGFKQKVLGYYNGTGASEPEYYRVRLSWENEASQLGAYESLVNAKINCPAGYSVYDPDGKRVYKNKSKSTQASAFKALSEEQAAEKILEMAREDSLKSGILASVTAAQMILESGYVTTELATKGNNCFGMKTNLSGNTWANSTWDGTSNVVVKTAEEYTPGMVTYVYAAFRKYPCIEDSIGDHSAYLLGAKDGSALRYKGLTSAKNYKEAATIIKNGGYATDSKYVDKLSKIIVRFDLDRYDDTEPVEPADSKVELEVGAKYKLTSNLLIRETPAGEGINYDGASNVAKKNSIRTEKGKCKLKKGTIVKCREIKEKNGSMWIRMSDGWIAANFKGDNKVTLYKFAPDKNEDGTKDEDTFKPYEVKVTSSDVRIRTKPSLSASTNGYSGKGTFTIVEEKEADGYTWGKLKSGAGWIAVSLDCVKKL